MQSNEAKALGVQEACNPRAVARLLVEVLDDLCVQDTDAAKGSSAVYLIMDKLASLGLYEQAVPGRFSTHYALCQIKNKGTSLTEERRVLYTHRDLELWCAEVLGRLEKPPFGPNEIRLVSVGEDQVQLHSARAGLVLERRLPLSVAVLLDLVERFSRSIDES